VVLTRTGNDAADIALRAVDQVRSEIGEANPWLDSRLVTGVVCPVSGTVSVEHGLTRTPRGWWVVRVYGAGGASLREDSADDAYLVLESFSATTVDLLVF
jgi:hypothetical protein